MLKVEVPILNLSLFIIFFWFGLLKPLGISPAEDLIISTVDWMPFFEPIVWCKIIGIWEILIGVFFLFNKTIKYALLLLFLQMTGPFKNIPFNISFRWVQLTGAMTILAFIGSSFFLSYNILVPNIDVMWISFTFIAISCLTFPHFITVYLMDKIELD